ALVADVEVGERLVHQQQTRAADECLGQEHALLLASREPAQRLVRVIAGADGVQRSLRRLSRPSASHETDAPAVAVEAKLDEVPAADRKLRVEYRPLRDVADGRITSSGGPSEHLELAGGGRKPAQDRADQGRLARSVG